MYISATSTNRWLLYKNVNTEDFWCKLWNLFCKPPSFQRLVHKTFPSRFGCKNFKHSTEPMCIHTICSFELCVQMDGCYIKTSIQKTDAKFETYLPVNMVNYCHPWDLSTEFFHPICWIVYRHIYHMYFCSACTNKWLLYKKLNIESTDAKFETSSSAGFNHAWDLSIKFLIQDTWIISNTIQNPMYIHTIYSFHLQTGGCYIKIWIQRRSTGNAKSETYSAFCKLPPSLRLVHQLPNSRWSKVITAEYCLTQKAWGMHSLCTFSLQTHCCYIGILIKNRTEQNLKYSSGSFHPWDLFQQVFHSTQSIITNRILNQCAYIP